MLCLATEHVLQVLVTLTILLFAAKLMARLVQRMKQPIVLGEIIAGIIIGPFAIGGLLLIDGRPIVMLDETVLIIGEISAIIILFVAGMGTTPKELMKLGAPSFTVGALGVVAPFFVGYFVFVSIGIESLHVIIVATALIATSIAISVKVLSELGRLQSREGRLILGAAVADDVLAITVLSVVLTMVRTGNINPNINGVALSLLQILGIYAATLVASVVAIPRLLNLEIWKPHGSTEVAATAACFAVSGAASFAGLSPIVGAFAAGMAVTASKAFQQIRQYAEKLDIVFAPSSLR